MCLWSNGFTDGWKCEDHFRLLRCFGMKQRRNVCSEQSEALRSTKLSRDSPNILFDGFQTERNGRLSLSHGVKTRGGGKDSIRRKRRGIQKSASWRGTGSVLKYQQFKGSKCSATVRMGESEEIDRSHDCEGFSAGWKADSRGQA